MTRKTYIMIYKSTYCVEQLIRRGHTPKYMNEKFTETLSTNTHWNIYYMMQTMIGAGKTVTVTVNVKRPLALATIGQSADKELKKEMNRVKETQLYELADASFFLHLFFFYVSLPKSEHPGNTHKLSLIPR